MNIISENPVPSLAQLRARIAALEGVGQDSVAGILSLGIAAIDTALPWGGLPRGCLHEIVGLAIEDGLEHGAALGFAAFWLGRLAADRRRPVLWVGGDELYAPGLAALGLTPERLVVVRPGRDAQALWAVEEGLRCRDLAGVLGEVWKLDATAARRLQLAARASGVTALLLNRGTAAGPALTRWRIGPASSESRTGVGPWRWRVELSHCRGKGVGEGRTVWLVEWNDATEGLHLISPADDRPTSLRGTEPSCATLG